MRPVAAEIVHKPIVPLWPELVVGVAAFAILCFVLMRHVFPRMERTFAARADAVDGGLARAEAARAEAGELLERYRAVLGEARTEAAHIRDRARADGDRVRQGLLAGARQESERIVATGAERLTAERQAVLHELRPAVETLAAELAARMVSPEWRDTTTGTGSPAGR
jgi:F-type H+-transporting ATPase subunit b